MKSYFPVISLTLFVFSILGCSDSSSSNSSECVPGEKGCVCIDGNICSGTLSCQSNTCNDALSSDEFDSETDGKVDSDTSIYNGTDTAIDSDSGSTVAFDTDSVEATDFDTIKETNTDFIGTTDDDTNTGSEEDSDSETTDDTSAALDTESDATDTEQSIDSESETATGCGDTDVYQQCGSDGNVHLYNTCGESLEIAKTCDSQCSSGCVNIAADSANCGTIVDNYLPCETITSPDRIGDFCFDGVCQSPGCGSNECNAVGIYFTLPDTNQRSCYSEESELTCPSSGMSYYGQDAQYGWDEANLASLRFSRDTTETVNPIVTDLVTSIVWQGCPSGLSGEQCETGSVSDLTWSEAIDYCESLDWAGKTDWRLPSAYELYSIVDNNRVLPAINTEIFPNTPIDARCWTSSSNGETEAWMVYLNVGGLGYYNKETNDVVGERSARCVRGTPVPTPSQRFSRTTSYNYIEDRDEAVVADNDTGLIWQGCVSGYSGESCGVGTIEYFTWTEALAYCEGLAWGNRDKWRLPNVKELQSLVNLKYSSPAIDTDAFPETPAEAFVSSTSQVRTADRNKAWQVHFEAGAVIYTAKTAERVVRCVSDQ